MLARVDAEYEQLPSRSRSHEDKVLVTVSVTEAV